jgi:diazepam-binding inhibitor (GABA receptor modulating acyl-CoA-binding protein)
MAVNFKIIKMQTEEQFQNAVKESKELSLKPSNEMMLLLYALYKQATLGDATEESAPAAFDFVAKAKYDSWQNQKGKTKEIAMQEYVALVEKLK